MLRIESTNRESTVRGTRKMPPAATCGNRPRQLLARLRVGQNSLHSLAQQTRTLSGFLQPVANDQQPRVPACLIENMSEQRYR